MSTEQPVDLDRIEKFLAHGRRHAASLWNIHDDGYCMASILDAAPAMVAELRALRAEVSGKGCGGTVGDHLAPDQGGCPGRFIIDGIEMVPATRRQP